MLSEAKHLGSSSMAAERKRDCRDPSPAEKHGALRMTEEIALWILGGNQRHSHDCFRENASISPSSALTCSGEGASA